MSCNNQGQTGPKSNAGKRRSSMNALKSGMFAKSPTLPYEDEAQYKRHIKAVIAGLLPEDAVQMYLAQQIGDSLWRGQRQEYRCALERDEIFKALTPAMMVQFLSLQGVVAKHPPSFLVDPNYKITAKQVKLYKTLYGQYEHFVANVKGATNYNMVWRQYQSFFEGLDGWMKNIHPSLYMSNKQGLDLYWQGRPKELEAHIDEFGALCWYVANFAKLRDQIRHWMSVWFFLKARHGESIERFEDRMFQERRVCQSLLDCYHRMRKSQIEHVLFTERRLKISPPKPLDDIVMPHEIPRIVIGSTELAQ